MTTTRYRRLAAPCGQSGVTKLWTGSAMQANGFSTRYADGGDVSGITSSPGLDERMARHRGHPRRRALPSSKPFWKE